MTKGGKISEVRQVGMPVAIKNISDSIVTGEVKSEDERWYLKYTGYQQKGFFINYTLTRRRFDEVP